jgi:metallo-beta-lactamase superfamily protein
MEDNNWFRRRQLTDALTVYDEPFVHGFFRANMFHLRGRDRDLIVDTGMGLARLSRAIAADPGKPLLALATHIHVDHGPWRHGESFSGERMREIARRYIEGSEA